jgi:translation initiation factor 3 subunit A
VLKRAHELIGVNQAPAALNLLHEHVTSKRSRNVPIVSLEPVMLLLVELSVEQKKGKLAKDALYQYKNISQNTNIATIEVRQLYDILRGILERLGCHVANAFAAGFEEIHRVGRGKGHRGTEKGRRSSI